MRYLWYSMYGFVTALAIYALFFRPPAPKESVSHHSPVEVNQTENVTADGKADVQIALILDTSSSMDGLVEQARAQLWEMVAEMQVDDQDRERTVAVALYQYGNNRLSKGEGFVEMLSPLTTDLDQVSVKLHELRTSGGKEYAPLAIQRAVTELEWNEDDSVERLIVIAGNEGFQQGPVSSQVAFSAASSKTITVLPIFCANRGTTKTAVSTWRSAASLAGADFDTIDPDQEVAQVNTPYDAEILEKYRQLEETKVYAPGMEASSYSARAEGYAGGSAAIDRAVVQSRQSSSQDLVAAYGKGKLEMKDMRSESLPDELRDKSLEEQTRLLSERQAKRNALKKEISELNSQRQQHIQKSAPAATAPGPASLGESFRRNTR